MDKFDKLVEVIDRLLGPNGCPWDKKQTLQSMKKDILEEVYELLDAIDSNEDFNILDELGDVLHCVIFMTKIAEKNRDITIEAILKNLVDKLIRRHPHIFSDTKVENADQVIENWEKIKKTEKTSIKRKTLFAGIPKSMPTLLKAQKMINILKRHKYDLPIKEKFESEEELGKKIFDILVQAENSNLDVENALSRHIKEYQENI